MYYRFPCKINRNVFNPNLNLYNIFTATFSEQTFVKLFLIYLIELFPMKKMPKINIKFT